MTEYDFKQYAVSFSIPRVLIESDRTYGQVTRNGKTYWRNYHRVLKNGQGFSTLDIMLLNAEATRRKMAEQIAFNTFQRGWEKK